MKKHTVPVPTEKNWQEDMADRLFTIKTPEEFIPYCMMIFHYQSLRCEVYRRYMDCIGVNPENVQRIEEIPFLPISFFKTHAITSDIRPPQRVFTSSGTTGSQLSQHFVTDTHIYDASLLEGFTRFYGPPSDYTILALLPSYLERQGSSLVYMAEKLMLHSAQLDNGFYLHDFNKLYDCLQRLKDSNRRVLLIGVTYALLDFAAAYPLCFPELTVMETGGMKGKREELLREERHRLLCKGFGVRKIHSEYGMTELLSQAYSQGDGIFYTPPWMQIRIRDCFDPFAAAADETVGGINCIDLANCYSCSFIETEDTGIRHADGGFEITGRLAQSDLRGCNLMYGN